jgi:hypothetical protein
MERNITIFMFGLAAFALLLFGGVMGGFIVNKNAVPAAECVCVTPTQELIFIHPDACTDICANISAYVEESAVKLGLAFREVALDMPDNVVYPAMYILGRDKMTTVEPFANKEDVNGIMCINWGFKEMCTPEILQKYTQYLNQITPTNQTQ